MATPGRQVQYQDYADSPFPPPSGPTGAAASPSLLIMSGIFLDYQAYAEPPLVPADVAPVLPDGVAAYLSTYPEPLRLRRLPEMGTAHVFLFPFLVGGSALSWVPVYRGREGLRTVLHPSVAIGTFDPITTPAVPAFSWGAYFPDRVGVRLIGPRATDIPDITAGFEPITPPAPPPELSWTPHFPDRVSVWTDPGRQMHVTGAISEPIVVSYASNAFILDQSLLGGAQYRTIPFDMAGEFRQVQFRWRQVTASQDMEPHYLEFHFTVAGVAEED